MIREVYEHDRHPDPRWLADAYGYAVRDHEMWNRAPHLAGKTGLSRYFDVGHGPVPEMADDATYYADVIRWFLAHPDQAEVMSSRRRAIRARKKQRRWRRRAAICGLRRCARMRTCWRVASIIG